MTFNTKYLALLAAFLLPASAFAQTTTATFIIEKVWNQPPSSALNAVEVTAHLSCTGGDPTEQDVVFTTTTDANLFVFNIGDASGPVDCTITETVPANYTASYNCNGGDCGDSGQGVDACFYANVDSDANETCTITNTPDDVTITVNKEWVIEGADQGFDGDYNIQVNCPGSIVNTVAGDGGSDDNQAFTVGNSATGDETFEFTIAGDELAFGGECSVYESNDDSVVESTFSGGCSGNGEDFDVNAGGAIECDITNTVFFEGIPTLNQYGMAILALLMLGVGFVGFRRFV